MESLDDAGIVELYLLRDEEAIGQTSAKYGSRLRAPGKRGSASGTLPVFIFVPSAAFFFLFFTTVFAVVPVIHIATLIDTESIPFNVLIFSGLIVITILRHIIPELLSMRE
jgi:hypothetical protein